jgi:hypothetical protein
MSNLTEIRDLAHGLHYVIRHTKNRDLAKESVEKLIGLRQSAAATQKRSSEDLVEYIDSVIEDAQEKIGFRPSDAADYLESQTSSSLNILVTILAYLLVLCAISTYVYMINQTINSGRFGKN